MAVGTAPFTVGTAGIIHCHRVLTQGLPFTVATTVTTACDAGVTVPMETETCHATCQAKAEGITCGFSTRNFVDLLDTVTSPLYRCFEAQADDSDFFWILTRVV